jgi:hypothetical protein
MYLTGAKVHATEARSAGQIMGRELSTLEHLSQCKAELEAATRHAARLALAQGHTWKQIGDALCVSPQAAWERYWGMTAIAGGKTQR